MAVTYGVATDVIELLQAIQTRLVASNIQLPGQTAGEYFAAPRILITLAPDDEWITDPPSDSFIILGPTVYTMDQGLVAGGGNYSMGTNGLFSLNFWNRYTPGQTHQDDQGLNDSTFGILTTWNAILAALQMFSPIDPLGTNSIAEEPARFIRWAVQPRKPNSEWLEIKSQLELKFIQSLS